MKWEGVKYATHEEVLSKAPVYKHAIVVETGNLFASGTKAPSDNRTVFEITTNDLRLNVGTAAIDAGEVLPGFNDGFSGKAPDLGAYEFGADFPHYGPRRVK
jgi:hypothetical protein